MIVRNLITDKLGFKRNHSLICTSKYQGWVSHDLATLFVRYPTDVNKFIDIHLNNPNKSDSLKEYRRFRLTFKKALRRFI